jgi:NADPH-dependent ferric siderophore reductase
MSGFDRVAEAPLRHRIERRRHETRRRPVTLVSKALLTPRMLRLGFQSAALGDFVSAAPDDHVKLFFPSGDATAADARPCMLRARRLSGPPPRKLAPPWRSAGRAAPPWCPTTSTGTY